MAQRTWLITGVSSGFGRQLTEQLLEQGERVVGTVRDTGKVAELRERYPETYRAELLDVTNMAAIHEVLERRPSKNMTSCSLKKSTGSMKGRPFSQQTTKSPYPCSKQQRPRNAQ